jgi:hypothetical protein
MRKVVIGAVLTAVFSIGVEDSQAAAWTVGSKNTEAKARSASEFGQDYKAGFSLIAEDFEALKGYLTDLGDNTTLSSDTKSKAKKAAAAIKGLYEFEEGESEDLKKTKLLSTAKKAADKGWTALDTNVRALVTIETCQSGQAQRLVILCARLLKDMKGITVLLSNEETQYIINLTTQTNNLVQSLAGQLQQFGATHPRTAEALAEVNEALNKVASVAAAAPVQQTQTYAPQPTYTTGQAAAPAAAPAPAASGGRR